jgi:hypothetical protein
MRRQRMQETAIKLDALSEMMALSSYGNTKNLLITAIEVNGPLDKEALNLAVQRATRSFPQLVSRIREVRERRAFPQCEWNSPCTTDAPVSLQ